MRFQYKQYSRRLRRMATWMALAALLLQAAVAGFHMPLAQAAAVPSHHELCPSDQSDGGSEPANPAHGFQHCPFCLTLQSGKPLPPSICLVLPPSEVARRLGPPRAEPTPAAAEAKPAHRPRGPPVPA